MRAHFDYLAPLEQSGTSYGHRESAKDATVPQSLSGLPLELIQKIYHECSDIKSVANLSTTSRKFRAAYNGSQKLLIIENVLERQFGPLHDAVQVVTYNESQPAHTLREPAISMALAQQIAAVGYTAERWEMIYPALRWRIDSEYRRVLRPQEAFRFRRAMYRLWHYTKAFHSSEFLELERGAPRPRSQDSRLTFIRRLHDDEILELTELHDILREMVHNDLCPSNAIIQQRYTQGFPGQPPLYFGSYETYPGNGSRKIVSKRDLPQDLVNEAWGTWEMQNSVVGDILKLEPNDLLHFRDNLANRTERMNYLSLMHESFHQSPSTLRAAIEAVITERDYWIDPFHGIDGGVVDFQDETDLLHVEDKLTCRNVASDSGYASGDKTESGSEEVTDEEDEEVNVDGFGCGT